jgi:type II secretory pathway pseudopilin PulG
VELMLVVLILGILAGLVTASISSPSQQAREVALKGQLRSMRSTIMLYKVQHGDMLPPANSFEAALTGATDERGNAPADAGARGPYMDRLPVNPYNGRRDVLVLDPGVALQPNDATGWIYQPDGNGNFTFVANASRSDMSGKPLAEY